MFLRVTKQKNKEGKTVEYLAFAKSKRLAGKAYPITKIVKNIGKSGPDSKNALKGLATSIQNYTSSFADSDADVNMFLRVKKKKNRNGVESDHVELVLSERVPGKRKPVVSVMHNFGKVDEKMVKTLNRLADSIHRYVVSD